MCLVWPIFNDLCLSLYCICSVNHNTISIFCIELCWNLSARCETGCLSLKNCYVIWYLWHFTRPNLTQWHDFHMSTQNDSPQIIIIIVIVINNIWLDTQLWSYVKRWYLNSFTKKYCGNFWVEPKCTCSSHSLHIEQTNSFIEAEKRIFMQMKYLYLCTRNGKSKPIHQSSEQNNEFLGINWITTNSHQSIDWRTWL